VETLKKNNQFQRVYSQGATKVNSYLVIYWLENNRQINRYGFSVSKKVGKAVVRNKIKRQLKEIIRRWLDPCLKQGFDIVIIARPYLRDLDFARMKKKLTELFREADFF